MSDLTQEQWERLVEEVFDGKIAVQVPRIDRITLGTYVTPDHLCPDLLRYEQIGPADNWRGRVVRAFFWVIRVWRV